MKIHILGICGTFMGGIAALAKELGHTVTGSDEHIYPPMSTQLEKLGIQLYELNSLEQFKCKPDIVIIGNALSRGNIAVEYVLRENIVYKSGPEWLSENVLQHRHVLAIAGTHGKTTTSSMLAWVLSYNGCKPGFLIGGIPENFGVSARLGNTPYFVIEADEYDSAFFDKRSKFVHYHCKTLVINNLEYDHADIFPDLKAIQTQFHYLLRTIPENGLIIRSSTSQTIDELISMGCWTAQEFIGSGGWEAELLSTDGSHFNVFFKQEKQASVKWNLIGEHNVENALAVFAAAHNIGISPSNVALALAEFKSVKRRMEIRAVVNNITVYDDFAHHPTAIEFTLKGLRAKVGEERIIAVVELASYTMRNGYYKASLLPALKCADEIILYKPTGKQWSFEGDTTSSFQLYSQYDDVAAAIIEIAHPNDHIIIMSNRGIERIFEMLILGFNKGEKHARIN